MLWLIVGCIVAAGAGGWYIAADKAIGWYLAGGSLAAVIVLGSWLLYEPKQKENK